MMDNDNSLHKRPTFKRALRNISMTSIFITMTLIWLLLSVTSVLTLKQYAQKNLALTAATMTYSLEAVSYTHLKPNCSRIARYVILIVNAICWKD